MHHRYDPHAEHHEHPHHGPARPRRWWRALPWLAAAYVATGFYAVQPNERAVVQRCGRMLPELRDPGLHFGFPCGIDRVTRVKMFELKRVGVGVGLAARELGRGDTQQAECLTGDRNLIQVSAVVQYRIENARAALFAVADVPQLVAAAASARLAEQIAGMKVDDVLTVERVAVQRDVQQAAQATLDRCAAGVQIAGVTLEAAAPPAEVAEAFRDVTAAREDRQRAINEADGYAGRLLPQTRGEVQQLHTQAAAYSAKVVKEAAGDAERFERMAENLALGRELTVRRLIFETLEKVLPRMKKVVLDPAARQGLDLGIIEPGP